MSADNTKVPGQIFRWFEKMKANYEKNLASILDRFEQNNEKQNLRIDSQNKRHLEELKTNFAQQLKDKNKTIEHLNEEIGFYKQQLSNQQKVLEQLNGRYDTVMHTLLSDTNSATSSFKDVLDENQESPDTLVLDSSSPESDKNDSEHPELLYQKGMELRALGEFDEAFILFEQSAILGDAKSMGALARAYFLNEGVNEDQVIGLSWLILAAQLEYEPAIKKCEHFKQNSPDLYEQSLELAQQR